MNSNYYIWIEIQANKRTIVDSGKFQAEMEKCRAAGIGAVILGVKDTTGFAIYNSKIAPHYFEYDEVFEDKDYLLECLRIVHGMGMKFYASVDVFAEGNKKNKHPKMPGFLHEDWQTYVYGLNAAKEAVIQPSTQETPLTTSGSIDDFGEIFVNPANEQVCDYELSLLNEIMMNYPIDGIVLDRVRYVGLSSDFSPTTKKKWDQYLNKECNWPEDIYRITEKDHKIELEYGTYFGDFITFRAGIIRSFVERVRELVDTQPRKVEFLDYTGSWYPLYYQVGANWASENYAATEYPWVNTETYKKTGYAEKVDGLLSGFYYPYITEEDAGKANQPAYWYSVEGSGRLASTVTEHVVPIVGSLFLDQYREDLDSMTDAVEMCFEKSAGCMLFDLSYLVENDWWRYVTLSNHGEVVLEQLEQSSFTELSDLWKECFSDEFLVSEERLKQATFEDERFCPQATFCLRSKYENKLLGAIVCKISKPEDELFQNAAWITALLVKPEYQNFGYGTRLYKEAEQVLKDEGIRKIYVGQDLQNIFSGIPAPSERKIRFFQKLSFTINVDEHYDLEADITRNDKMDHFDSAVFEKQFITEPLTHGQYKDLYQFLEQEFPGRWLFSAKEYLENDGDPNNIVVLMDKLDHRIKGYCVVNVNEDRSGGLGPIGIAGSIRGNKNGDFMLQQSLMHLRTLGAKTICIDWTILKDFYGKFDFIPVRVYRSAYKEL